MWTLIIIIVVVVVVDDDTYYWVYLSSDHLFQVYYKVRQVLLQSATAFFITKCDGLLLQSATAFLLQSATSVITKCDRYYKVWQFYYKVRQVLQSATIITKCDSTIVHMQSSNFELLLCILRMLFEWQNFYWQMQAPWEATAQLSSEAFKKWLCVVMFQHYPPTDLLTETVGY